MNKKISSYKDLIVWQKSHQIALSVFDLFKSTRKGNSTKEIWKQVLRSVFSTPANIVEGYYGHKGKSLISKLSIAKGEAGESDYWLFVLSEVNGITKKQYHEYSSVLIEVIKMLTALQKKVKV